MGFVFGGLWALIAAMFKAKLGISEIIVTIMLNYIAINFLGIAVRTFLMDPAGSIPQSPKLGPFCHPLPVLKAHQASRGLYHCRAHGVSCLVYTGKDNGGI